MVTNYCVQTLMNLPRHSTLLGRKWPQFLQERKCFCTKALVFRPKKCAAVWHYDSQHAFVALRLQLSLRLWLLLASKLCWQPIEFKANWGPLFVVVMRRPCQHKVEASTISSGGTLLAELTVQATIKLCSKKCTCTWSSQHDRGGIGGCRIICSEVRHVVGVAGSPILNLWIFLNIIPSRNKRSWKSALRVLFLMCCFLHAV